VMGDSVTGELRTALDTAATSETVAEALFFVARSDSERQRRSAPVRGSGSFLCRARMGCYVVCRGSRPVVQSMRSVVRYRAWLNMLLRQ
jgi:hypothetical protein